MDFTKKRRCSPVRLTSSFFYLLFYPSPIIPSIPSNNAYIALAIEISSAISNLHSSSQDKYKKKIAN